MDSKKITWISILQGWTMLLVVMGHATLNKMSDPNYAEIGFIYKYFAFFRMPLFIFISGYLFYMTRISKNLSYREVVLDKVNRLIIPYIGFTIIVYALKVFFSEFMNRGVELTLSNFLSAFIYPYTNPFNALWFVAVAFILMLFYNQYKGILKSKAISIIFWFILLFLNVFFPSGIEFLAISRVCKLAIFFYSGIYFCHFNLESYFKKKYLVFVFFIVYNIFVYLLMNKLMLPELSFFATFSGILFSISLAKIIAGYYPKFFGSFRNYTYQIYLLGIFPQMLLQIIFIQNGEANYYLYYFLSIISGLYLPVFLSLIILKVRFKPITLLVGLKHKKI